jgi:hypothetical protein
VQQTTKHPKKRDTWRVVRCFYHKRHRAITDLKTQGFVVHDSYLSASSVVKDSEEFTIVAKRVELS